MEVHVLNALTVHHTTRRKNLQVVIEDIHMNLRTQNLIVTVDQRIDQNFADRFVRIIAALFPPHPPDAPGILAVVSDEVLGVLQQRNQTGPLKFFVIQGVLVDVAFAVSFPPGTENSRLLEDPLIAEQQTTIGHLAVRRYQSGRRQILYQVKIFLF